MLMNKYKIKDLVMIKNYKKLRIFYKNCMKIKKNKRNHYKQYKFK